MSMDGEAGAEDGAPMSSEDELARAIAMSIAEAENDGDDPDDGAADNQP